MLRTAGFRADRWFEIALVPVADAPGEILDPVVGIGRAQQLDLSVVQPRPAIGIRVDPEWVEHPNAWPLASTVLKL